MKSSKHHENTAAEQRAGRTASKDSLQQADPATREKPTDANGDSKDGTGEDNHHAKKKPK